MGAPTIEEVQLGDIANLVNGRPFGPEDWGKKGLPIIRIQNLTDPAASFDYFDGDVKDEHKVRNGDLLLSWSGTLDVFIWNRGDAVLNQHIFRVIPDISRVTRDFLYLALKAAMQGIRGRVSGATMQHIRKGDLEKTRLVLPAIERQEIAATRLVEALDEASNAIGNCKAATIAGALLPEKILRTEFRLDSAISTTVLQGKLSGGWRWHRLLNVAQLESGHTPSRRRPDWWGGDVPWLALPDIRKLHGKYVYATTEYTNDAGLANSSARLLPVGTVCLSRTASVGFATILGKPMATSQDFCNWICGPELDEEFLMYAFMASHVYLRELGSGAVHKTIYMPTIKTFHVCAPDINEQRRIARVLHNSFAAALSLNDFLKARLTEIERLPSRLLVTAFGST